MTRFRWGGACAGLQGLLPFFILLVTLEVGHVRGEGDNSINQVEFGDPDYSRLNRNATRCSSTNETLLHTWELNGLLKYLLFLQRFDQSFEVKTEEVNFKSENVDGKWVFRFTKLNPNLLQTKSLIEENLPNHQQASPMKVSASYSYDGTTQKRINFGIYLTILYDNKELVLPIQTSSEPTVSQQRTYVTARANAPPIFTFTHTFAWPDVLEEFQSLVSGSGNPRAEGVNRDDLSLRFLIMAYYPNDPLFSQHNDNCNEELLSAEISSSHSSSTSSSSSSSKASQNPRPPFIKHTNSMLNDDKYTDLYLRVGNEDFPAHRIILATTSPVFSALIYNETLLSLNAAAAEAANPDGNISNNNNKNNHYIHPDVILHYGGGGLLNGSLGGSSEPPGPFPVIIPTIIHIDDDISAETVEEMLRYIYTGKVEGLEVLSAELIVAAERYGLPELKRMCEGVIMGQVKLPNAIDIYMLGMQVNSIKLTKKAFHIMRANKSKIVSQFDEFRKLSIKYPSLMFELFVS